MNKRLHLLIEPDHIDDLEVIRSRLEAVTGKPVHDFRIVRRSVDARRKQPLFSLQVEIIPSPDPDHPETPIFQANRVALPRLGRQAVLIVGAGPAGYLAALTLLDHGMRPVILERGRDVTSRRKSLARIVRDGTIDPDSNYCFGEGGAGTYSDGKLFTRSTKRGDVRAILNLLVAHGARQEILIDAHPHIGSNRLPRIIESMRCFIEQNGGEVHFNSRVTDFILAGETITGVQVGADKKFAGEAVILACGHSARDVFELMYRRGLYLEPKPFALGVRVEHPQALIDAIQYHHSPRHAKLPAATYRLKCQVAGRGVYSFCMCPGGYIVPTSTAAGELVLNGMSLAGRGGRFANAGIVVEIGPQDLGPKGDRHPFAYLKQQMAVEQQMYVADGHGSLRAPAQRMTDFVAGKISTNLPATSYLPGIYAAPLHRLLPAHVAQRLRQALPLFGRKLRGYFTREAVVMAVESRTSSPVRIPRDPHLLTHPQVRNLYPCGEGAGYAGGIISSAMDGQRVARRLAEALGGK